MLAAIMLVACLEFVQNGMLNFAASAVMGGIGAAPEEFSYAAMAYATAAILVLFNHHRCTGLLGLRRFVRLSILLFALGAVLCATAGSATAFILGRAVQGLGGAVFFTAARVEVQSLPAARRTVGLLCFGYALLLGSSLGPLLGALALQHLDWRWIFWGILPWLLLTLPATRYLSQQPDEAPQGGISGVVLAALAAAVLFGQWLIQQLPYDYFSQPQWLLRLLAGTLTAAAAALWLRPRRSDASPAWPALARLPYLLGLTLYFCCYLLVSANSYIVPVMVQQALGYDVPTTGRLLSVSFLAGTVFATLYAALVFRSLAPGLRAMLLLACGLLATYGLQMAGQSPDVGIRRLVALLLLNGGFMSLFIMAVAQGTFREIAPAHFARAYQTKNIIRQLALSMGVAGSTVFLQARNAQHYQRLSEGFDWNHPPFIAAMEALRGLFPQLGPGQRLALLAGELSRQATLMACQDFFRAEYVLALGLMALIAWQRHFD